MIGSYIVAYWIQCVAEIFTQTSNRLAYDTFSSDQRLPIHYTDQKRRSRIYPASPKNQESLTNILSEISLQQTLESFAVSCLVACHLMDCVMDCIELRRSRHQREAEGSSLCCLSRLRREALQILLHALPLHKQPSPSTDRFPDILHGKQLLP